MSANILIVDDSATMRQVIRRTLTMSGLDIGEMFEAGNGIEAFACLAENSDVALVLLDINMPVMNGVQFLQRMHVDERLRSVPVVIASTEGSETRISQLLAEGARGYVRKPFQPEQIRAALSPFLGTREPEEEGAAAFEDGAF